MIVRPVAGDHSMLFSISETVWWLIAITATAFFMVGMHVFLTGMKVPEEARELVERQTRQGKAAFYVLTPLLAAVLLGLNLLRPEPAADILFLYSVAFVSIPLALFPVRGRMLRLYVAQLREPGAPAKSDKLATAWIVGFLMVVIAVAVVALMAGRR
ncbi:hypothetical protein ACFHW2_08605 [Actinomadura sp. LOL_016]|uniref:hypothetical protein n=1 Tax=unclassified Actinomadura TaxID=2626254 RepID=UPI003A7FDE72